MCPPRTAPLLAAAAALLAAPIVAVAYREGPLPAMTGGFGEPTCRTCHFDNPVNDPGGSLRIDGVPNVYTPNHEYTFTVLLRRKATVRGGFEMSARFATGSHAGQQAGRLRAADGRTQVIHAPRGTVEYVQHTKDGSAITPGVGRWIVHWTAPETPLGPVILHVAANASNDDSSPLGDFVYTITATSRAR